jgi:retinol dehydrogenase-12
MSLASVKQFADEFKSRHNQLHILLNNAGVMLCPFGLSEDGIETQFATNHVAHYYLTILLLPILESSGPSRVVNVSSIGHKIPFKQLNLDSISDPKKYHKIIHYSKSKVRVLLRLDFIIRKIDAKLYRLVIFCSQKNSVNV